jgi:hypothetical protein
MSGNKSSAKKTSKNRAQKVAQPASDADVCVKGGAHEWEQADGGTYCKKCHEQQPQTKRTRKSDAKPAKAKPSRLPADKQLSAIDAAAKILGELKQPMNTRALVEAMSAKGYWSSPGGKTPWATLYSAILAEITKKGKESRFKKTDRGHFALKA